MPRTKTLKQAKRFNAVVDIDTYTTLVTLTGRQTMIERRPVSLAEFVRVILEDAVNGVEQVRVPSQDVDSANPVSEISKTRDAAQGRLNKIGVHDEEC